MRIRLLIDCVLREDEITPLAELIHDQPVLNMEMPAPFGLTGGRLVGAQPVHVDGE